MTYSKSSRILARKATQQTRRLSVDEEVTTTQTAQRATKGRSAAVYIGINFAFLVCVVILSFTDRIVAHNPAFYLILLMALLSSPVLFARSFTGPYLLLWVAAPFFFLMFGMGDLVSYISDRPPALFDPPASVLTYGEIGILIGFSCLFLGYATAVGTLKAQSTRWFVTEWPVKTSFVVGLLLFAIGMIATFFFQIRYSMFQVQIQEMGQLVVNLLVLGRMVGELGEILLAYVLVRTRNNAVKIVIILLIISKVPLAIILNAKYIGVSFIMAYIVVAWIYRKSVPWKGLIAASVAVALMFPLAYQYRAYMGKYHVSVGETLEDISGNLSKALKDEVAEQQERGLIDSVFSGLESIARRADLKPAVELIVARTGSSVDYQGGNTLKPIFFILIPRFIYPEKPDVPVGKLFNRQFKISADPDTWISTSFIGELYWNFSWAGIVVGMLSVGYVFGAVGTLTCMDERTSIARILIVLITVATLVFKFQTGIAQQYSVFVRSLIIVVLLHILFSIRKTRKSA